VPPTRRRSLATRKEKRGGKTQGDVKPRQKGEETDKLEEIWSQNIHCQIVDFQFLIDSVFDQTTSERRRKKKESNEHTRRRSKKQRRERLRVSGVLQSFH
jgi:hypothetical protein